MLATLKVRDLVLIAEASLDFAAGLNVLTGETGAGKSILLDALGLATGARAGARSSIRPGAAQGAATAIFDLAPHHEVRAVLAENAIPSEGEIILRRSLATDGRTRGFVNDEAVGVALLRDIGSSLVEIHGQADDRGLFDAATHRRLLDAFGGHEGAARATALAHQAWQVLQREVETLKSAAAQASADAEFLRHAVNELETLAPEQGEEESLAAERALLMNASRIAEDIDAAIEALAGDGGAEARLAAALKRLSRSNEEARKATATAEQGLEQAFAQASEARRELESFLSRLELDAGALERKEERLFALRAAARKYAVTPDTLASLLVEFRERLSTVDGGDEKIRAREKEEVTAKARYLDEARELSAARIRAARRLEEAVARELAPLKLAHAQFRVLLESLPEPNAGGLERVAFEVATIQGAAFGALAKIASGGELARFSLALKVALSETSPPAALVFDEVDRGVGGAVADAVGERLQRLARTTQVLLVTHAPQVAARAARHFRISRRGDRTAIELLSDEERIEEIARMLSGAAVTEEARAAAKRLIEEAREQPKKIRKRA